ncbi:unnamed protein product [Citrullus colocynthis]|uniref:SCP domain-containing protein n=1 Tax=Citrullus colocynthis TaxID=252529 RepID=A0ABP0Z7T1_9ROSI
MAMTIEDEDSMALLPFGSSSGIGAFIPHYRQRATQEGSPQDYVNAHNVAPAQVGVGPIQWDENVAIYAKEFVNQRINNNCELVHSVCGHYTQVVWKDSIRIGCAKANCRTGGAFIVCNYDPHGNIIGQRPY